jgi:hypothetical protein
MIVDKKRDRDLPEFAPNAVWRTMNGASRRTAHSSRAFEDVTTRLQLGRRR